MFLIIVPVIIPFFMSLGLTMSEIFFVQAMFGLSMAIFEVPSAYLGDMWGRKNTLILGSLISGLSFSMLIFADGFWSLLFYEVILAIGASFISGADMAIMYDSLEDDRLAKVKSVSNFHSMQLIGESIAALSCSFLMIYGFKFVVGAQALIGWFPLLVAMTLKEPQIIKMEKGQHRKNLKEVFKHIFLNDQLMRSIFINMVVWSLSTFCAIWIIQKYWQDLHFEVFHLGILWALCNITAALVGRISFKLEQNIGAKRLLLIMTLLPVVAYITMGFFTGVLGLLATILFYVSRGINMVVMREAFNHRIPNKFRNTANSLSSFFFRIGFFILGPITGLIIDKYGMNSALLSLGVLFGLGIVGLMLPLLRRI